MNTLKFKLQLENFSGKAEVSVYQDFYATVYLAGHAAARAEDANKHIAALGKLEPYEAWQRELKLPVASLPAFSDPLEEMFFTRMLYSCLVDADFLGTETFMAGAEQERGGGGRIEDLEQTLQSTSPAGSRLRTS